jgi:hypothetical protein
MTVVQIKEEIHKALNLVPETALADVLDFVKSRQAPITDKNTLEHNLAKIMGEDKGLLERLAQ